MVPRFGNTNLKDVGIAKHGVGRRKAATRMSIDSGAVNINPGISLCQLLHGGDLIGQGVVAQIAVIGVVEFFGPQRIPHSVDFNHDETKLGKRLRIATRG